MKIIILVDDIFRDVMIMMNLSDDATEQESGGVVIFSLPMTPLLMKDVKLKKIGTPCILYRLAGIIIIIVIHCGQEKKLTRS